MSNFDALHSAVESLRNAKDHLDSENLEHYFIKETPASRVATASARTGTASSSKHTPSSKSGRRAQTASQSEGAKELNRQLQNQKFQKEIDDAQFRIDTKLRAMAALDNEDMDEQFGVERNKSTGLALNIRTLEDRTMRAQSMLALEHYMGSFVGKKIHDELEAADTWFRKQAKTFRVDLQAVGVDFDEIPKPPLNQAEDEYEAMMFVDDIGEEEELGVPRSPRSRGGGSPRTRNIFSRGEGATADDTAPESIDTQSSAAILQNLLSKLKLAQQSWQTQTAALVGKLKEDLEERAESLSRNIRQHEHEIAVLHRKSNAMDEGLSTTDEGKIRSSVDAKFQASQTVLEEKLVRQKERKAQAVEEARSLAKELHWLQSLQGTGEQGDGSGSAGKSASGIMQQLLTKAQAQNRELEDQWTAKKKILEQLTLEADDSRDEMRSLQAKSKQMATDLEKIKADQVLELQGLRYEYGLTVARTDEATNKREEAEMKMKALLKTARGKARNTMRLSAVGKLAGRKSFKRTNSNSSVKSGDGSQSPKSASGTERGRSPLSGSRPGSHSGSRPGSVGDAMAVEHESIWPRPAGMQQSRGGSGGDSSRGTLMSIREKGGGDRERGEEETGEESAVINPSALANVVIEEEESDLLSLEEEEGGSLAESTAEFFEDADMYIPTALSNIAQAAYLRTAQILIDKSASEAAKAVKKKAPSKKANPKKGETKKSTSVPAEKNNGPTEPQLTPLEGLDVFKYVLEDLRAGKYLEKRFDENLTEEMAPLRRELPVMRPEEIEAVIIKHSISLCNHMATHTPHLLVAKNKHGEFRKVLFHILTLIGVIFECCPLTNDELIADFNTHPLIVKFMEEAGLAVIGSICGGASENVESVAAAEGSNPSDDEAEEDNKKLKKTKKAKKAKKAKKRKGSTDDGRCSSDPLHPHLVFKQADITVSELEMDLKMAGFLPGLEKFRQWTREISHGKKKDEMDESWFNCSRLHYPDSPHSITSEDRHHMCAYQAFFLHLGSVQVYEHSNGRLENMDPTVDLETRLATTLKSSGRFDDAMTELGTLLRSVIPAAVPVIFAMEFARRVVDEDIIKRDMMIRINKGEDADLNFLRTRASTPDVDDEEAKREAELAAKEAAFLSSLPSRERTYLVEKKIDITDMIQEILKLTDSDDEDEEKGSDDEEEELEAVKLTKILKKNLLSHLVNMEEKAVSNMKRGNVSAVDQEVEAFAPHLKAIESLRNKVLDVGGIYTKPLREKLDKLNEQIISSIATNRELEVNIEIKIGEIGTIGEIVDKILEGLDAILKGTLSVVGEELENLLFDSAPDSMALRESRTATLEQLRSDLRRLSTIADKDRVNYEEMRMKLQTIAAAMSYSVTDAWNQGLHITGSLVRQLIRRKLLMTSRLTASVSSSSGGDHDASSLGSGSGSSSTLFSAINTELPNRLERVATLVIEYMGREPLVNLGAMHLDDLITQDLARALRQFMSSREVARRLKAETIMLATSSRKPKVGSNVLKTVSQEKSADTTALPQLLTAADIQAAKKPQSRSSRASIIASSSSSVGRSNASGGTPVASVSGPPPPSSPRNKSARREPTPDNEKDSEPRSATATSAEGQERPSSEHDALPATIPKSSKPPMGRPAPSKGRLKSTFASKGSIPSGRSDNGSGNSSVISLALIGSTSNRSSISSIKSSSPHSSRKSVSSTRSIHKHSSGIVGNTSSATINGGSSAVIRADMSDSSMLLPLPTAVSTTLLEAEEEALKNPQEPANIPPSSPIAVPPKREQVSRGRLRATISSLTGEEGEDESSVESGRH